MPKNILEAKTKEPLLRMFFLKNDETKNELRELNQIDSEEIKRLFENGELAYIKVKEEQESDAKSIIYERERNPRYLVSS